MRKVIYQFWIPTISGDPETGKFSELHSGYFHGWGYNAIEGEHSLVMNSIALVEDSTTGYVHKVDPRELRFVQPVDFRVHKSEKI